MTPRNYPRSPAGGTRWLRSFSVRFSFPDSRAVLHPGVYLPAWMSACQGIANIIRNVAKIKDRGVTPAASSNIPGAGFRQ